MQRTVERAIEAGINYFDTAQAYGNGASETNLGRVLKQLKPQVIVGSKVQLRDGDFEHIEDAIAHSIESSLRRLQLDRLDLFQLHNPIGLTRRAERGWVGLADLDAAARAFRKLQSSIANGVRSGLLGDDTPDTGCGIKLFAREVFMDLPRFDHMHRFLPALFMRQGARVVSIPVGHRPRTRGTSKYGMLNRVFVGIVDIFGVMWLRRRYKPGLLVRED